MIWIDPETQSYLIVLTSRLYPDGRGDVKPLRQDLARLVGAFSRGEPELIPAESGDVRGLRQTRPNPSDDSAN